MSALVFVEHSDGVLDDVSTQALTFARELGGEVAAVAIGAEPSVGSYGATKLRVAELDEAYAPAAWAAAVVQVVGEFSPGVVAAAGTDRGNEVMAHVAARLDLPFAANCVGVVPGEPLVVTRTRWGGSLLEQARIHGDVALLTVQPHAIAASAASRGEVAVERFTPSVSEEDRTVRVVDRVAASGGGVSLAEAKVVVSGGRGVGSTEGFAIVEELAGLLGAAVGCSRAVTMAGWRPHTDQVGQTGTKIAPEIYIACGISGATQHMAGCKGAKKLLAINADAEAPIFASADYAVTGDLHEILPAISAEIRRAQVGKAGGA
jgi:electron transfer flavoprotein alpha subunit